MMDRGTHFIEKDACSNGLTHLGRITSPGCSRVAVHVEPWGPLLPDRGHPVCREIEAGRSALGSSQSTAQGVRARAGMNLLRASLTGNPVGQWRWLDGAVTPRPTVVPLGTTRHAGTVGSTNPARTAWDLPSGMAGGFLFLTLTLVFVSVPRLFLTLLNK